MAVPVGSALADAVAWVVKPEPGCDLTVPENASAAPPRRTLHFALRDFPWPSSTLLSTACCGIAGILRSNASGTWLLCSKRMRAAEAELRGLDQTLADES